MRRVTATIAREKSGREALACCAEAQRYIKKEECAKAGHSDDRGGDVIVHRVRLLR